MIKVENLCKRYDDFSVLENVSTEIHKGDVVGIIEAMKLMNEVTAPQDGIVDSILAEDGKMVEYNQILITLK